MKNVSEEDVNYYLNDFRRALSPRLKSGVGIQTIWVAFSEGCVIEIKLGFGIRAKSEKRAETDDLKRAFERIGISIDNKLKMKFQSTRYILLKDIVILVKGDDIRLWDKDNASKDVSELIKIIYS